MRYKSFKQIKPSYTPKYSDKMLIYLLKLLKFFIKPPISFVRKLKRALLTKVNKNIKMLKKHIKKK
jgi:hypothetical protein